jgi:hypothetical protein
MRRYSSYSVSPRYTPGSPAQVDERTALRVAEEERRSYEHYLEGVYGEDNKTMAETKGLRGVVELLSEKGKGWDVLDVCLGEEFRRPFHVKVKVQGLKAVTVKRKDKIVYRLGPPLSEGGTLPLRATVDDLRPDALVIGGEEINVFRFTYIDRDREAMMKGTQL